MFDPNPEPATDPKIAQLDEVTKVTSDPGVHMLVRILKGEPQPTGTEADPDHDDKEV